MKLRIRNSTNRLAWSKRTVVVGWLALVLLAAAACQRGVATVTERPIQVVEVAAVVATDSARDLVLSGTVEADRSWSLSFATPGTVEQVFVEEGARVGGGQVLARMSARSYRDALGIAQAKAAQAEDAYRRLEPMYKNKTLPEVKMVEIEAGRQQARLAVSMAQNAVEDTVLRAPESGVIARRQVEPGMNMAPGLPAFTLIQTRSMLATAPLPEKQIQRVRVGDRAEVTVDALGKTIEGTVTDIGLSADILTRSYPVKVAIPNKDGALRVGMIAEVRLRQEGGGEALVLPSQAIHADGVGNNQVFVVTSTSRIERRPVEVLGFLKDGVAVKSGVSEGERVVTSGTPMLFDGMAVRIRNSASPDTKAGNAGPKDIAAPDGSASAAPSEGSAPRGTSASVARPQGTAVRATTGIARAQRSTPRGASGTAKQPRSSASPEASRIAIRAEVGAAPAVSVSVARAGETPPPSPSLGKSRGVEAR